MDEMTALVTGGNRGIGLAVCRQLAAAGHRVLLGTRDAAAGKDAVRSLEGDVTSVVVDVSDTTSVQAAVARIDRLDVLVNNAGVDYDTDQSVVGADLDRVHRAFEVNLFGAWRMIQACAPLLRTSGQSRIVNVSSGSGALSEMGAGTPGYSTAKAALNALTATAAAELRREGILVNAVCPGWVRTDMGGQAADRSPDEGAAGVVWAATLPDDGPTGGFFRDGRRIEW
ncbi:SDR family NAD(P)-dependent oxidoreductase [Euzebya tangerina]|uniref:SDR family NAD(P)-dependent oxidoreductase n=1 Tax=Euzebya tangerina TaxID=591198 RepID=UPI00196B2064|nr:SDR family NAD(P)-dependent oxidoreductase [Euzebya tangerina]